MSSEQVEPKSDSSSAVYDPEPFETFHVRVLELSKSVLIPANGNISVERMRGGGFNRIVGVSLLSHFGARRNVPHSPAYPDMVHEMRYCGKT
ncbi:hypothetical protein PISL3812_02451 [Talaromyces islandicus]|uniref:Uncharacterized protein n=1 Tax=Talaromyces islandicus TaxID=28573 RepID=A0A0U1LPX5_TALIS|nr:hypothetical protein PISL3812_02451 [Talaromyces islandicus]